FTSAGNAKTDNMELIIHNTHGKDMRQYNQPTASEVAAIFDIDLNQTPKPRDIVLKTREGTLKHISELNGAYDPLHYPLLFPRGEYGWQDRKSTRLNSSHVAISYAVFCLKKKNKILKYYYV